MGLFRGSSSLSAEQISRLPDGTEVNIPLKDLKPSIPDDGDVSHRGEKPIVVRVDPPALLLRILTFGLAQGTITIQDGNHSFYEKRRTGKPDQTVTVVKDDGWFEYETE